MPNSKAQSKAWPLLWALLLATAVQAEEEIRVARVYYGEGMDYQTYAHYVALPSPALTATINRSSPRSGIDTSFGYFRNDASSLTGLNLDGRTELNGPWSAFVSASLIRASYSPNLFHSASVGLGFQGDDYSVSSSLGGFQSPDFSLPLVSLEGSFPVALTTKLTLTTPLLEEVALYEMRASESQFQVAWAPEVTPWLGVDLQHVFRLTHTSNALAEGLGVETQLRVGFGSRRGWQVGPWAKWVRWESQNEQLRGELDERVSIVGLFTSFDPDVDFAGVGVGASAGVGTDLSVSEGSSGVAYGQLKLQKRLVDSIEIRLEGGIEIRGWDDLAKGGTQTGKVSILGNF